MVDFRPEAGIRIAPHFYNTGDEVDAALTELAAIRDGR
jgi:selenocysteine lyase/cysteine desulfurase